MDYDNNGGFLTATNIEERPRNKQDLKSSPKLANKEQMKKSNSSLTKSQLRNNTTKHKSEFPIINASKPREMISNIKSMTNFNKKDGINVENHCHEVRNYMEEKKQTMQRNKHELKNFNSNFTKNFTNNYLENRSQKIQDSMDRLYEKEKEKVAERINRLEKQNQFSSEISEWERRVEELKSYHNAQVYKIKGFEKKIDGLDTVLKN